MMMEAAPIAPFIMAEADLLLEFPIVPLDAPAHLNDAHQLLERDVYRQGGQEISGWIGATLGLFDEQPFFLPEPVGLRGAHARPCEARGERCVSVFTPNAVTHD